MEALRTESLSKSFGGVGAVKGVSFTVETGEKLALIGPNGAGKTTLFNLLNGQEKPTSGHIYFFGQDITRLPTYSRAHLGQARSFQLTSLFPNLTVIANAMMAIHGTRPSRYRFFRPFTSFDDVVIKANEILLAMNLSDRKDDLVQNLGYGEQRRLEIALSLASDPKMLLLDEPSGGLTPNESADMITMIRNLREDITVLMVAHDMDLVFGLAERIMVLHYGEIIVDGTPEEIQHSPRVKEIYMGDEEGMDNA